MASAIPAIVETLLATQCEDDERKELLKLKSELQQNADSRHYWLLWIEQQGPPELLDRFLLYAFVRAFTPVEVSMETVLKRDASTIAGSIEALSRPVSSAQDSIVPLLDEATWSTQTLRTIAKLIQQIEDPRVRQKVLQFCFSAIARQSHDATSEWVIAATPVLLLGVTDVWSAVRKQSAHAASKIVFQFQSLDLIASFIGSLLKIVNSDSWKAQEGALLTVRALLSEIRVDRTAQSNTATGATNQAATTAVEMVKGTTVLPSSMTFYLGKKHQGLPHLPRSLAFKLKPALYMTLKHAQVSVRETAAECLVRYMGICDESTRVLTFQEVMSKLNRLAPATGQATELQNQASIELLDAAEAEGLLDVLGKLVPHLPVPFLVKHWKLVFPTLERYVIHIASSVRLRSSAVVLALAELAERDSSSSPASLDLLHQMLIALADHREDVSVCWQRLEGRMLSVDLLVGLLGKDHLWQRGTGSSLLHFPATPRKTRADSWLPDGATNATWSIDEEEAARLQKKGAEAPTLSIIDRLNAYVVSKKLSSEDMWERVLRGWLSQTQAAFNSRQFELRRIARQALPGLVRLSLWCNQVPLLKPCASLNANSEPKAGNPCHVDGWSWTCLRHLLLHTELIRGTSSASSMVVSTRVFTATVLDSYQRSTVVEDPEAVVARVEAVVMAALSFGQATPSLPSLETQLHSALLDVHASLQSDFHHPSVLSCSLASSDASLDRQLSITLVPLLPAIAKSATAKVWSMMERIALSWLATDDMFRWITIDKNTAHALLLLVLDELLAHPHAEALPQDDASFIVRTLESAIVVEQLKDSAVRCLTRIYASLWRCVESQPSNRTQVKIIKKLAQLDTKRRSLTSKEVTLQPAKSDWDDWDGEGDEGEAETVSEKLQELRPLSSTDDTSTRSAVASELVCMLQPVQLDILRTSLDNLIQSEDRGLASCREALQRLSSSLIDL